MQIAYLNNLILFRDFSNVHFIITNNLNNLQLFKSGLSMPN